MGKNGVIALLFFITTIAWGQQLPDVGKVLEGIKPIPDIRQEKKLPTVEIQQREPPRTRDPSTRRIPIKSFKISGNSVYSDEILLALVKRYEGTKLTLAEIRDTIELISQYYRDRGYFLARAYLPAQEISEGNIEIAIIEGKVGEVQIKTQGKVRLSETRAKSFLATLKSGAIVNEHDLERSLLLLNDLPQVQAKATLLPGKSPGTTDIIVELEQARLVTGSVDFDNYGSVSTGRNRLGGALNLNDLSGLGDSLNLRITTTGSGLSYGRIAYTVPFNGQGSRVGIAYSDVQYELQENFASLNATGDARITSLFLTHPFIRSRALNLNAQLNFDRKLLQDKVEVTNSINNKTASIANIGFTLDNKDDFLGGGFNTFGANYFRGKLNIETPETRIADESGHQTQGSFGKYSFNVSRLQYLARTLSMYLSASGQLASKNLDSSEKFALAGAYAVRAYPQGEVSGDDGILATGEIRWEAYNSSITDFSLVGFIDSGKVKINHDPLPTDTRNSRVLSGAGISLVWSKPNNYSVRLGYARKLNPKPTDSDGSRGQLLFQAYKLF